MWSDWGSGYQLSYDRLVNDVLVYLEKDMLGNILWAEDGSRHRRRRWHRYQMRGDWRSGDQLSHDRLVKGLMAWLNRDMVNECEILCAEMVQDIEVGGDGTDIKCGVIGEVGTSYPMTGE